MTNEINIAASKEALDSIKSLKIKGLQKSITPWWFALTMAIAGGVVFALSGMEASRFYMAPFFLVLVFAAIYETQKTGVISKFPTKRTSALMIAGVIAVLVPLIFVARELKDIYGFLAPLSLGVIVTLVVLFIFIAERCWLLTKINAELDK